MKGSSTIQGDILFEKSVLSEVLQYFCKSKKSKFDCPYNDYFIATLISLIIT